MGDLGVIVGLVVLVVVVVVGASLQPLQRNVSRNCFRILAVYDTEGCPFYIIFSTIPTNKGILFKYFGPP